MKKVVILKGNIVHTPEPKKFQRVKNGYLVAVDNEIQGIYQELPKEYGGQPVTDWGDALIMPGMYDMHVHAPQYVYRGLAWICS